MGLQFEQRWLKDQRLTLTFVELFHSHCLIRLIISSENNDFGFNSFQKFNFSKKIHLNVFVGKFDLAVK